jgi:hypothetical protein
VFKRASGRSLTIVAVLAGLLHPAKAGADPIVITSGSLTITLQQTRSWFSFMGDGLSLGGFLTNDSESPLWTVCEPCRAGSRPVVVGFGGDMGAASGTVGGTHYSQLYLSGGFGVSGTTWIPSDGPSVFSVSFPFSVAPGSFLVGHTQPPFQQNDPPVFRVGVTGTGTGELTLARVSDPRFPDVSSSLYFARSARFDFGPESPSPTPEPATLLLCASGLVLAGARRLRRR